jgi:uncharacterized protein YcbX
MNATLTQLNIFPLKSGAAVSCESAQVEARGLRDDRRWMVVDEAGNFMTGRKHPAMTLIRARPHERGLHVEAPRMPSMNVLPNPSQSVAAKVWDDSVVAVGANANADAWISQYLGQTARFVYMSANVHRPVLQKYGRAGDEVSFADGYPLLLISEAALDFLNSKLAAPIPMLRFRPNLVIGGTDAHAEDGWRRIRIGDIELDIVKPCVRCVFTTVDPSRGERDPSGEPLRTLLGYRRSPKGVTFGQNVIPRRLGTLRVGDRVEVIA